MNNTSFTYVTGNKGKLARMKKILGDTFESAALDVEEIQSLNPREIARHKALQAFKELQMPVLVEDTSLHINSLGGLPGSFIKWFLEAVDTDGICSMTSGDRRARGVNTFAFYDGVEIHYFEGVIHGTIADYPRGTNGFGWDACFILDGESRTKAEMSEQEAADRSGRTIALKEFTLFIEQRRKNEA